MQDFSGLGRLRAITLAIWCSVVAVMPFHKVLSSPLLILSFFFILFSGQWAEKWTALKHTPRWWAFSSIYLIAVFGFLLSDDRSEALRDLNIKLYLVLIPLFFTFYGEITDTSRRLLLQVFVFACAAFGATALGIAGYTYFTTGENQFYYKYLVGFTYIHPSYVAMFMVFAIILITYQIITRWRTLSRARTCGLLALILFLMLFILLLTAKIAIASMFLVLTIAFVIWGLKYIGWKRTVLVAIAGNFLLFLAMLALPYTRERMLMLLHYNEVNYTNSVDSRKEIWKASIQVWKAHPVVGTGSGDAQRMLVEQYGKNGFTVGVEERYNTHNAYLQVLVETGLIGLALLLGYCMLCLRWAWKDRNYLWGAFLLLFMLNITTESMFKTQSGVVFFSFFNTLLGLHSNRK